MGEIELRNLQLLPGGFVGEEYNPQIPQIPQICIKDSA